MMRAGTTKPMILRDAKTRKQEREQRSSPQVADHFSGNCLPVLSGQILQSHPPGHRHMFLGELPDEGLRYALVQKKPTVGANHHTLLTPRKHDVRPSLVLHEPRRRGSDYRDDDVVRFVSLKRVDVEHSVFPGEACGFQGVLDRVPLGVVGGDDLNDFLSLM
jgi:hypothetical protein